MSQITENKGFVRFNAEATLSYNMVEGPAKLSEAGKVSPHFGGSVIESEGQNYAVFVGDGKLQLNLDVQSFDLGGHNLFIHRGALSVSVCLEEEDSKDFIDALRRKGSGDWLNLEASVEIDINRGPVVEKRVVPLDALWMGRDDGSTDKMRKMGPDNYQIQLIDFPYPLLLQGAPQNEELYHIDLRMGGLTLRLKLEPGEHRTLRKILKQHQSQS